MYSSDADVSSSSIHTDTDRRVDKESRHRIIFNYWPRDPKGKVITPENSVVGKMIPGKIQLWGETLNNFFYTSRFPSDPKNPGKGTNGTLTISTSSKLLGWMEKHGEEYEPALDDRLEARYEEDPYVIEPFDIAILIRQQEKRALRHAFKLDAAQMKLAPRPSPRSPSYPMPWPRPPYSSNAKWAEPPLLEKFIPLSQLPKNLIVHDPWHTLDGTVNRQRSPWKIPIAGFKAVQYRLRLSSAGEKRLNSELEAEKKRQEEQAEITAAFLADPHTRNAFPENGILICTDDESDDEDIEVSPRVFCLLPPPPRVNPDDPAHLRLTPSHILGSGNHSVLYNAEYEVPRDLLVDRLICNSCVIDAAMRICDEEDEVDATKKWSKLKGTVTSQGRYPGRTPLTLDRFSGEELSQDYRYEGPVRVVKVDVGYIMPFDEPCKHLINAAEDIRFPPTATVRVAAKLSAQGDRHLVSEARNYESFPEHFFQHWSGLCIPPRQMYPVPVGAISPQYYGFYFFDKLIDETDPVAEGPLTKAQAESLENDSPRGYYSPIMLMENCGKPIEADELHIDDREQAISLFNRFHNDGWCHGSLYQRNIVMKPGPISAPPSDRLQNSMGNRGLGQDWVFRLIDYGRSRNFDDKNHPCYDKNAKDIMDREKQILWGWMSNGQIPGL